MIYKVRDFQLEDLRAEKYHRPEYWRVAKVQDFELQKFLGLTQKRRGRAYAPRATAPYTTAILVMSFLADIPLDERIVPPDRLIRCSTNPSSSPRSERS